LTNTKQQAYLSGRYFTAEEIKQVQETVRVFSSLSWHELLQTICEHLNWVTPTGSCKVASCAKALKKLEREGVVQLPCKRLCRGAPQKVLIGERTDPEREVAGSVRDIAPVAVAPVTDKVEMRLWNEFVQRYHNLGYRRPCGAHQRYFITGERGRRLGCLMFGPSAWALAERDRWIGWTKNHRAQRLNWVVANTRFLLFPWVRVKNLASTALSLVAKRIRQDWQDRYGYAPVLLETFVEAGRYRGTSYQAANWILLGVTAGRGRMDRRMQYLSTPKLIYVYPLVDDFRSFLQGRRREQTKPPIAPSVIEREESGTEEGRKEAEATTGGRRAGTEVEAGHLQRHK
jgi:hypothetical protein